MNKPDNLERVEAIILQGKGSVGCAVVQGKKVCFEQARMFSGGRLLLIEESWKVGIPRVPHFVQAADPSVAAYLRRRFGNN